MNSIYDTILAHECKGDDIIIAKEVYFDKELIDMLLSINTRNRPTIGKNIEFFEQKIKSNDWPRGAFIVTVNRSMTWMMDAQHHLIALKNSGYPTVRGVIRIVPDEIAEPTFNALDFGVARNASTQAQLFGMKNASVIQSIVTDYNCICSAAPVKMDTKTLMKQEEELRDAIYVMPITKAMHKPDGKTVKVKAYVFGTFLKVLTNGFNEDYVSGYLNEFLSGSYSSGDPLHGPRAMRDLYLSEPSLTKGQLRVLLLKSFNAYVNCTTLSPVWKRVEENDGNNLGLRYIGEKIILHSENKHIANRKSKKQSK